MAMDTMDVDARVGPAELLGSDECSVVSVSCGSSHTVALLSCDMVLAWGRGEDGQLGQGDAEERLVPTAISALLAKGVSVVVCGAEYALAWCKDSREVYSWGWGDFGRLGHGDCDDVFVPEPIKALSGIPISFISCGDTHTLAVTTSGELYSFGRNQNGQLGLGTTEDSLVPRLVEALKGIKVTGVSAGAEHTVAAVDTGEVYSWGWGRYGNLGDGDRKDRHLPTKVKGFEGVYVTSVACGWRHSGAVDAEGRVYTFGWCKYGQLGHGDFNDQLVAKRVEGVADKRITLIAGGWRHTVAADESGKLYAWGWNKFGQLGIGKCLDACAPQPVEALAGEVVAQLSCGWRHTVAVTESGNFYSWGRGVNGQLGHGDTKDVSSPRLLKALSQGGLNPTELAKTLTPATAYVPPADRYAVVPDQPKGLTGSMAVPEMPGAKKQRM